LGLAALLLGAATFRRRHLHLATAFAVGVCVFAVGAVHVRYVYFAVPDNHVVTYTKSTSILATLCGRIVTSPQIYEDTAELGYRRPPRTAFLLEARSIRTQAGWEETTGLVRVTIDEPNERLAAGQDVELLGWLGRFRGPSNPGQFDWSAAMRDKQVLARMTVKSADGATVLGNRDRPWYVSAFWRLRASARQHWSSCGDLQSGRLLNALIIGERHPVLRRLNRTMVRAGIAHFLSISGLHLGVFLSFIYLLCRLARLTPRRAGIVVLVILAVYVLLAESRPPLLRSAIMAAFLCIAVIFYRRYAALNALAAAAILLLAIEPLQIFQAGFQLSFVIVAGLVLLHRPVRELIFAHWIRRRGLMVFRGEHGTRRWLYHNAADWLMSGITMCIVAYVVAAPLVAWHFGLFSPYAALLSAAFFPLVLAVLLPGYLSIALAWPMPNLSYSIGRIA
ncbi:MAG: ComEC/Rec2 family competence protein, partial [Phycisphaerae bacterium]|nr:ComEC/Rec2 family competence protein [Phycisphaerae bacterium]